MRYSTFMTNDKKEEFKKHLEKERTDLLKQLSVDEKPADFGDDVDDFDEETNEAEAFANQSAEGQVLKDRLSEIDIALAKIVDNKYGICESCGKEIEAEVLNAAPESRFCNNCKAKNR